MSDGQAVEFDSPLALLQNKKSYFSAMVAKTGNEASGRLHQIAVEADRAKNRETWNREDLVSCSVCYSGIGEDYSVASL